MPKEVKLHVGCGPVYLENYLNVDYGGLSSLNNPDQKAENITDIQHYYRYPYKPAPFGKKPNERQVVVDLIADATRLPLAPESVNSILCVNFINHVRFQDFKPMVNDWHRILVPNGELIIDIDDVLKMSLNVVKAGLLRNTDKLEKALRYLYCHSRTRFDSHYWGYTPDYLKKLLKPIGFDFSWRNDNFINHDAGYPRFLLAFKKRII